MNNRLLLGVIIADCHIDFQAEILRGLISQSFKANCDLAIFAPLHNFSIESIHKSTEKQLFDLVFSDSIDGIIYARDSLQNDNIRAYIDDICVRSGKPVMLLDSDEHRIFETTSVDDCETFETITDHLIDVHSCKKIFCLTGPKNNFSAEQRRQGYLRSLKKHGISPQKHWCEYGDFWHDAASDMAKRIISGALEKPDAVVCGNDVSAMELCSTLIAGGLRVPEDIAVTGYDASPEGLKAVPSITGYFRPNFQLGAEAVRRLYRIITGRICPRVHTENGGLCLGQSCGCKVTYSPKRKKTRSAAVNSRYENYLLYGDMLFDISNTGSSGAFADRLDNYTFYLSRLQRMRICLTEDYIASTASSAGKTSEKLSFSHNSAMQTILAKTSAGREYDKNISFSADSILPDLAEKRKYPSAYFISPLHYNDNFFGYSAVSFGKAPVSLASLYIQWINYVNVALEQMRIRSILNNTAVFADKALSHDSDTVLLNGNNAENAADVNSDPRFEKLCWLRGQMHKTPELPWNISSIADKLYLSKSYLQKIYKSCFGKSIIEELIVFRIEKAKGLLADTDMKIIEVSEKCGYSSYNYFVRQFRNVEGISPTEYREERKNENNES